MRNEVWWWHGFRNMCDACLKQPIMWLWINPRPLKKWHLTISLFIIEKTHFHSSFSYNFGRFATKSLGDSGEKTDNLLLYSLLKHEKIDGWPLSDFKTMQVNLRWIIVGMTLMTRIMKCLWPIINMIKWISHQMNGLT